MSTTTPVRLRKPKKPKNTSVCCHYFTVIKRGGQVLKRTIPFLVLLFVNYAVTQGFTFSNIAQIHLFVNSKSRYYCLPQYAMYAVSMYHSNPAPFTALHHFSFRTLPGVLILSHMTHRKSFKSEISSKPNRLYWRNFNWR